MTKKLFVSRKPSKGVNCKEHFVTHNHAGKTANDLTSVTAYQEGMNQLSAVT